MDSQVRAARPEDPAAGLLYESARPYYDAYAGGEARARRIVAAVYGRRGHNAGYDVCRVALLDGEITGVLAGYPAEQGEALAGRFLTLTALRIPAWRWPNLLRHLRAARSIAPVPPSRSFYVDGLAVAEGFRRRGVARALIEDAEVSARAAGASGIALDTGIENAAARAFYEALGFEPRGERRVSDAAAAASIGGVGFVSYFRAVA